MTDILIRAIVLLVVAWGATAALRRQSAALRASIWTAALAGVLLLPALTVVTPAMKIPVWAPSSPSSYTAQSPAPVADAPAALEPPATVDAVAPVAVAPVAEVETEAHVAPVSFSISRADAALTLWGLVAVALAVRILWSHRSLRRGAGRREAASPDWQATVAEACDTLELRRGVRVAFSDEVSVPVVIGVWRPVLLLPVDAVEWDAGLRRAVALHELAHVARWDGLSQLVSQLACAVYWFVPLTWMGARQAAALREQASDDVVLRAGVAPASYAEHLIGVARAATGVAQPAALAMAKSSHLRDRILAILDPASPRVRTSRRVVATAVVLVAAAVVVTSAVELTARAYTADQ